MDYREPLGDGLARQLSPGYRNVLEQWREPRLRKSSAAYAGALGDFQTHQISRKRSARVEYSAHTPSLEGKSFPTTRCSVGALSS
jgi:hypothetical protein